MKFSKPFLAVALLCTFLLPNLVPGANAAPDAVLQVKSAIDWLPSACDSDCTLREAILAANATVGVRETITFKIPTNSTNCDNTTKVCTIPLLAALPDITDPVVIDGYTQKGAHPNTLQSGNDAVLRIVVDGTDSETSGFILKAGNSTIRGLVISNFGSPQNPSGISLQSDGNSVQGNFIGTDVSGLFAQGNANGVTVTGAHNLVGGTTPAARNVISRNGTGIYLSGSDNVLQGNYIGTKRDGHEALGNAFAGIKFFNAKRNTIGGKGIGARNLIADNSNGIEIVGGSSDNKILGNYIGLDVERGPLGNHIHGIQMYAYGNPTQNVLNNLIARNTIAHNNGAGIKLGFGVTEASFGNRYSHNAIYLNKDAGIENYKPGSDPNDLLDGDAGPNMGQNHPAITQAKSAKGKTTLKGELVSAKNTTYRIEFFINELCDADGYGEGNQYLGAITVQTDEDGIAEFTWTKNKTIGAAYKLTATATEKVGGKLRSTSEFSACVNMSN